MRRSSVAAALGLSLIFGCRGCGSEPPPTDLFLGGIQVNEPDHAEWARALRAHGMNTVSATVYAKHGDWDRAHLWWEAEEPAVVSEVRAAKAAGLRVVLILRVALDHAFEKNRFLWHGQIHPIGPAELDAWFDRYAEFVRLWAARAAELDVDVLGVGSELSSLTSSRPAAELPDLLTYYLDPEAQAHMHAELLEHADQIRPEHWAALGGGDYAELGGFLQARSEVWRAWAETVVGDGTAQERLTRLNARRAHIERRWRALISEVRPLFSGQLTYAANFDQYQDVAFWDALDLIGVNAYFQLRDPKRPARGDLDAELLEGWREVLSDLDGFRRAAAVPEHPVLFTELGYTQHRDASFEPWAMQGLSVLGPKEARRLYIWQDQPKAPEERAAAVRALDRAQAERPGLFAGLLYWKLTTKSYHRDVEPFGLLLEEGGEDPLLDVLHAFGRTR